MANAKSKIEVDVDSNFNAKGFDKANAAVRGTVKEVKGVTSGVMRATSALGEMGGTAGKAASAIGSVFMGFRFGGIIGGIVAIGTAISMWWIDKARTAAEEFQKATDKMKAAVSASFERVMGKVISETTGKMDAMTAAISRASKAFETMFGRAEKSAKAEDAVTAATNRLATETAKSTGASKSELATLAYNQTVASGRRSVDEASAAYEHSRQHLTNAENYQSISSNEAEAQRNRAASLRETSDTAKANGDRDSAARINAQADAIEKKASAMSAAAEDALAEARMQNDVAAKELKAAQLKEAADNLAAAGAVKEAKAEESAEAAAKAKADQRKALEEQTKNLEAQNRIDSAAAAAKLKTAQDNLSAYLQSQVGVAGVAFGQFSQNENADARAARSKRSIGPSKANMNRWMKIEDKLGRGETLTEAENQFRGKMWKWRNANNPAELAKRQQAVADAQRAQDNIKNNLDCKLSTIKQQLDKLGLS